MRVCYLIQTHKNPEQIYRLVKVIKTSSPNSQVIVSHDNKCKLDVALLQTLTGVQVFITEVDRGAFSTIQNYLDAVDWLFRNNIEFDWLVNITGQDYPIQPLAQIEKFLTETTYDGFMEYFEVFSKQSQWSIREGCTRYLYRYHILVRNLREWQKELLKPLAIINYIQPFFRINFARGIRFGIRTSVPFNDEFICYGGSFFCTLSRECVQYIHDFATSNDEVIGYYQGVNVSVESFLQTVLINSQLFNLCNDCKRYFDFSGTRNGHPRVLTTKDYPALVESDAHFARKFDLAVDSKILDLLDERIFQSSQEEYLEAKTV